MQLVQLVRNAQLAQLVQLVQLAGNVQLAQLVAPDAPPPRLALLVR